VRVKQFNERWVQFWQKFAQLAESEGVLYDETLFETIVVPWLQHISSSPLRIWRQMGTMAAFALTSTLNELTATLLQREQVINSQLEDKKIGKGAGALKKEVETIGAHLAIIQDNVDSLFAGSAERLLAGSSLDLSLCCVFLTPLFLLLVLSSFQCVRASLPRRRSRYSLVVHREAGRVAAAAALYLAG
jgi:hypothetical protein